MAMNATHNHTSKDSASEILSDVPANLRDSPYLDQVNTTNSASSEPGLKQSRAAKRREKRAMQRKAEQEALTRSSAIASDSSRSREYDRINEQLKTRNLAVFEIPSDGDCLYRSIAHQLARRKISFHDLRLLCGLDPPEQQWGIDDRNSPEAMTRFLRFLTSRYLMENMSEFLPFMFNPDSGEPMSADEFMVYCQSVEQPSTWGGQIEIRAIAHALQIPIEVVQGDGPPILTGEEFNGPPITIIFHRHAFALGEHYNSSVPLSMDD